MPDYRYKPFITVISCPFAEIATDTSLSPIEKKSTMCMLQDFEDGKWRLNDFMDYIWDNIADTALNAEERIALGTRPSSLMTRAAKNLRITDKDVAGGEIAEILLYAIMRNYYGALPVVPKIYYKQNANDYAKGADSVHIIIESADEFSLWLGEAKFYDSIEDSRLTKIVDSVYNTLSTEKIKKENSIIVGIRDLSLLDIPKELLSNIYKLLNKDISIDNIKPLLHIPILILHECNITAKATQLNEEYLKKIKEFYIDRINSYYKKQISKCASDIHLYSEICFHLMIIPVPKKSEIVNRFTERANNFRK